MSINKTQKVVLRLIIISLFLVCPLRLFAFNLNNLSEGQAAFNAGNYTQALTLWRVLAEQGQPDAQVFVGLAYANGWGTEKDITKSIYWYRMAAENNNSTGQFLLGLFYLDSDNQSESLQGIRWLQKAANNGDPSAIVFLDKARQKKWFEIPPEPVDPAYDETNKTPSTPTTDSLTLSNRDITDMPISTELSVERKM